MKIIETYTKTEKNGKLAAYEKIEAFGKLFIVKLDKNGKALIKNEIVRVEEILNKEEIKHYDRMELLRIYNVVYHETGKIEGIYSLDSSATNCGFCATMRKYAAEHPELNIVCGMCYDFAQEQYRFSALNRHTLNLVIMENVEFTIEELSTLPCGELARVNSSGDSSNDIYAANMIKFCFAHPFSKTAIWSKHTITYIHAIEKYGKPENVVMIQSSLFVDKAVKLAKYFDYVFTVYKDKEAVKKALDSGACECNGKKCRDCGYKCYYGLWSKGANIAELLR